MNIRNYLLSRIKRENYRGVHIAQHNRLPFDKAIALLSNIYDAVGSEKFAVPPGDDHGKRDPQFVVFYRVVDNIAKTLGQGTVNSVKKNHFPDFARMGFLDRHGSNGTVISPKERRPVISAQLTEAAIQMAKTNNPREQYKLYLNAVEQLTGPEILDELFGILHNEFETISVYEFMLILSDPEISRTKKIALLRGYRKLSTMQRNALHAEIQSECDSLSSQAEDKIGKRDYGNWYNQAVEIFTLLNQTVYFKTFKKTVLMLGFSNEALEFFANRSATARAQALQWHEIKEREGYDLHHIVPLENAISRRTLESLDDYRNLLCLRRTVHRKIPAKNNLFVQLAAPNLDKVILINPFAQDAQIDVSRDVLCRQENLPDMVKYNQQLLNSMI